MTEAVQNEAVQNESEQNMPFTPNEGKNLVITTDDGSFERYPVKTPIIKSGDDLVALLNELVKPYLQDGDMIYMSEKILAISQGRAFKIEDIKPSRLAKFLTKFVYKSPYGIGLGMPETMELAIRSVGRPKIIFAAIISGIGKLFGKRGVFYNLLGPAARAIDGPCDCTIPPYNGYAKMAPDKPHVAAKNFTEAMGGHQVIVVDANDIGVNILGKPSQDVPDEYYSRIFKDNPLGQGHEQTPLCIVRKIG